MIKRLRKLSKYLNQEEIVMIVNNSFNNQMINYRNSMNALIHEKEGMAPAILEQKKEKANQLAKTIFSIEGTDSFQQMTCQLIDKICDVKPGRKLMKIFSQHLTKKIIIKGGDKSKFSPEINTVIISEPCYYVAIKNKQIVTTKQNLEIVLVHEMIHAMHEKINNPLFVSSSRSKDIFRCMTNLEEQFTISGFNHHLFCQKTSINKYDVLCENAFLLAMNLLPRICHFGVIPENPIENIGNRKETLQEYYDWLENEYHLIAEIPENKQNDEEFILDFLKDHPMVFTSISNELKSKEFLLKVIHFNKSLIFDNHPELRSDKEFIKKAITIEDTTFLYISDELLKDKEFVIYAINKIKNFRYKGMLFKKLENKLKSDSEIQAITPEWAISSYLK